MNGVHPRGQVLLITVLVLSVAVTIALSLIGRTVSDVSMSKNLEESARAFNAAEAGIEEALRTNTLQEAPKSYGNAGYTYRIDPMANSAGVYTLPTILLGQAGTVWLVGHNALNQIDESSYYQHPTIDICWSHVTPNPALEVALYYKSGGSYFVHRGFYDPNSSEWPVEDPENINGGCNGMEEAYHQPVSIPIGVIPLFMLIRPYYGNATVSVFPLGDGNILPTQGFIVSSVGCTQISSEGCIEGGVTRKIVVRRQYPQAATIFDYSLYSQSSLMH